MCDDGDTISTSGALRDSGRSKRGIARDVAVGALIRVAHGLYATPGVCSEVRAAAAHGGALACVSAARHAGLWVLDDTAITHVRLGAHGHARRHSGCRCVPHWDGEAADAFGVPSIPRVLLQILRCRGVEEFFVALESARRQGLLTRADIAWLGAHAGPDGREAISRSRDDADSGLESLLRWRLRHHGLSLRTQVSIVAVGRVDVVIGERLIIEVDGAPHHDGPSHRHRDLVRDAHAAIWGYVTLRFDYAMVVHDWATVELAVLAHVERGRHLAR